jgi:hypothetical protein
MQRELVSLAQKPAGHQSHRGPQTSLAQWRRSHSQLRSPLPIPNPQRVFGDLDIELVLGALYVGLKRVQVGADFRLHGAQILCGRGGSALDFLIDSLYGVSRGSTCLLLTGFELLARLFLCGPKRILDVLCSH